ncbi:MAG: NAD(P)-binding domain-containing protein, partial [Bryobacteraceae bacterium]|nr:NAD(P)-binding domain-containing protein [Bryobacteraceae bacterium]
MRIGIIGTGKVGTGLAGIWTANGHEVLLGARNPEKVASEIAALGNKARAGTVREAAAFGEVVVLAVQFWNVQDALQNAGSLNGKILFSCVNALKQDYSGLALGTTTSAAEEIAKLAPAARVVSGLPPFAELLHSAPALVAGEKGTLFVAGDDTEAKAIVRDLLAET